MNRMTRILIVAFSVVLAWSMTALAQPPPDMKTDPKVTPANFTPHPFGMQRCETCEGSSCVVEVVPRKKTVYTSKCVPFCLPYCHHGCDADCGDCGVVAHRKILIKKSIDCGTDARCVAKPCPPCAVEVPAKP